MCVVLCKDRPWHIHGVSCVDNIIYGLIILPVQWRTNNFFVKKGHLVFRADRSGAVHVGRHKEEDSGISEFATRLDLAITFAMGYDYAKCPIPAAAMPQAKLGSALCLEAIELIGERP